MKKRPSLVLREPVKLYDPKREEQKEPEVKKEELKNIVEFVDFAPKPEARQKEDSSETIVKTEVIAPSGKNPQLVREKMSPRIRQIWDYFCKKAVADGEVKRSFSLTRTEVMKEAGIGSTNTYRDALKKFQELNLMEIELRPGVNSGSIFKLTKKGIEQLSEEKA